MTITEKLLSVLVELKKCQFTVYQFRLTNFCGIYVPSNSAAQICVAQTGGFSGNGTFYFNHSCKFSFQIVFVLRKKNNQVSFLHVFHHGGLVLVSWISLNYAPGGPHVLSGYINCCVHVVMYLYYLLSTWMERKQLWWKKYITILQVVGFAKFWEHIIY